MKKEHAKALYRMGGESKEIALQYFPENELSDTRPKSWRELNQISGYFISDLSVIQSEHELFVEDSNRNIFPTKEYAEAALALAQLLQIKKRWFDGEIVYSDNVFGIAHDNLHKEIGVYEYSVTPYWTHFPNRQMAEEFINEPEIRKLLEQVKPLL